MAINLKNNNEQEKMRIAGHLASEILTMIGEETGVKYKVVPLEEHHEKDADGNVIPHEVKEDTEAAKSLRAKKVAKIMSYKK